MQSVTRLIMPMSLSASQPTKQPTNQPTRISIIICCFNFQVFTVPVEERRFKEMTEQQFGEKGGQQAKICSDIMNKCGELSGKMPSQKRNPSGLVTLFRALYFICSLMITWHCGNQFSSDH